MEHGRAKRSIDDAEKTAQSFAWSYFAFHAQQRQIVFNFFVVLIGASLAAFAATIDKPTAPKLHAVIGCVLMICSFLFWRLDARSRCLIQLAEASLGSISRPDALGFQHARWVGSQDA
ncbi:RipA family octameric membrane protein [Bradyrhizobium niftali]